MLFQLQCSLPYFRNFNKKKQASEDDVNTISKECQFISREGSVLGPEVS